MFLLLFSFLEKAQSHLYLIHIARSVCQEQVLKHLMLAMWREAGEEKLASWLEKELLNERFSVTSSGIPGSDCCAQFHETMFRQSKRDMEGQDLRGTKKKTDIGSYLTESIVQQSKSLCIERPCHLPVNTSTPDGKKFRCAVHKASILAEIDGNTEHGDICNYIKVSKNLLLTPKHQRGQNSIRLKKCGYVINSNDHLTYEDFGNKMTISRATKFLLSLHGKFDKHVNFKEASDICLGCHFVSIDNGVYECTCAAFWHCTECSHTILVQHLEGIHCIHELRGRHDAALLTGRPRKGIGQGFIRLPKNLMSNETSGGTTLQGLEVAKRIDGHDRFAKINQLHLDREEEYSYHVTWAPTTTLSPLKEQLELREVLECSRYFLWLHDIAERNDIFHV